MENISQVSWPSIKGYERIAQGLYNAVLWGVPDASMDVEYEKNLPVLIEEAFLEIAKEPTWTGLSFEQTHTLMNDEFARRAAIRAGIVRASIFWPLSALIYLVPQLKEIGCYGVDFWSIRAGEGFEVINDQIPFSSMREIEKYLEFFTSIPQLDDLGIKVDTYKEQSEFLRTIPVKPIAYWKIEKEDKINE